MSAWPFLGWTLEHHWVSVDDAAIDRGGPVRRCRVGLSAFAQAHLGEVVAVELPGPGTRLSAGEVYGEVESTITVADLFAPVSGVVVAINTALAGSPELVNADPERDGWLVEVDADVPQEWSRLLDTATYRRRTQGSSERGTRRTDDDRR